MSDLRHQDRSKREQEHERMLEEALSRPGVAEIMKVYQNWQKQDEVLSRYRASTNHATRVTSTNAVNIT